MARIAFASVLVIAMCAAAACSGPPVRKTPARLRVVAEPRTAAVYVDDRFVSSARVLAVRPLVLEPGVRHVTVQAPGYFPHDLELDLASGETTIRIALRAIPP